MQNHGHRLSPPKNEKNRSDKHHYGGFPYHNTFRSAKVYDFKAPRHCFFKASAPNKTTFSYDGIHHVRKKHQSRSFDSHLTQKETFAALCPEPSQFPNDRLSSEEQNINAYSDRYRHGFSPCSLFTAKACAWHFTALATLCVTY